MDIKKLSDVSGLFSKGMEYVKKYVLLGISLVLGWIVVADNYLDKTDKELEEVKVKLEALKADLEEDAEPEDQDSILIK